MGIAIKLYQRHGLLAVVVPALLPPPVPFKVVHDVAPYKSRMLPNRSGAGSFILFVLARIAVYRGNSGGLVSPRS